MATRTVTPAQQIENVRESLWQQEYALQDRGIPAREIMALVRLALSIHDLEQKAARGELEPYEVHVCDDQCERVGPYNWCREMMDAE